MPETLGPPSSCTAAPLRLVFTQNLPNSRNAATSMLKILQDKPVFPRDRASCDRHHVTDTATLGHNRWVCWVEFKQVSEGFPLFTNTTFAATRVKHSEPKQHSFMTTPPGCDGQWERGRVNVKHLSLTWCTWDNQYPHRLKRHVWIGLWACFEGNWTVTLLQLRR